MGERSAFGVDVRVVDREVVVVVTGEVDMASAPELDAVLTGAIEGAAGWVVVDAEGVTFFGSDGVRSVVDHTRAARERGIELRLRRPSARVREVLELTGLAGFLTIEPAPASVTR